MRKTKMTKQRMNILKRAEISALLWGYGDKGGKEYFFSDGSYAKSRVVEGMIDAGLLKIEDGPLEPGQQIRAIPQ